MGGWRLRAGIVVVCLAALQAAIPVLAQDDTSSSEFLDVHLLLGGERHAGQVTGCQPRTACREDGGAAPPDVVVGPDEPFDIDSPLPPRHSLLELKPAGPGSARSMRRHRPTGLYRTPARAGRYDLRWIGYWTDPERPAPALRAVVRFPIRVTHSLALSQVAPANGLPPGDLLVDSRRLRMHDGGPCERIVQCSQRVETAPVRVPTGATAHLDLDEKQARDGLVGYFDAISESALRTRPFVIDPQARRILLPGRPGRYVLEVAPLQRRLPGPGVTHWFLVLDVTGPVASSRPAWPLIAVLVGAIAGGGVLALRAWRRPGRF